VRPKCAGEGHDDGPGQVDAIVHRGVCASDRKSASSGRCVLIAARAGRRRGVTRGCATRALLGPTNAGLAPCLTRSSSLRRPMVVGRPPYTLPDRGRSAGRGSERSARRSSSRARRPAPTPPPGPRLHTTAGHPKGGPLSTGATGPLFDRLDIARGLSAYAPLRALAVGASGRSAAGSDVGGRGFGGVALGGAATPSPATRARSAATCVSIDYRVAQSTLEYDVTSRSTMLSAPPVGISRLASSSTPRSRPAPARRGATGVGLERVDQAALVAPRPFPGRWRP
jgi:hypothetical protein